MYVFVFLSVKCLFSKNGYGKFKINLRYPQQILLISEGRARVLTALICRFPTSQLYFVSHLTSPSPPWLRENISRGTARVLSHTTQNIFYAPKTGGAVPDELF